jgi:hypothetical protein
VVALAAPDCRLWVVGKIVTSSRLDIEERARRSLNEHRGTTAKKSVLSVGTAGASHEFDMFEEGKIIRGISTSPWTNKTGTTNTGGQDRATAELLWLSLWSGQEVRVLTDTEMAEKIYGRFAGCPFPYPIEILNFDIAAGEFTSKGILGTT